MNYSFSRIIENYTPRILTQICRDPGCKAYGSCDRNWWHYKMRDFSSIILQQGGYYLAEAAELAEYSTERDAMRNLAKATLDFWQIRVLRYGAFEEYYPWERGYPAVAFSTLAAVKLIRALNLPVQAYQKGLHKALRQLLKRHEFEASNQYFAGLAALYILHSIAPEWIEQNELNSRLQELLRRQSPEGWFNEYGGPDLAYLSVTIDCLWDIYDVCPAAAILPAIRKAITFMASLLYRDASIGMHNSRNTDYILPYGIIRALQFPDATLSQSALQIAERLFANLDDPRHFLRAIDDRYISHYIGVSVLRAHALQASHPLPQLQQSPPLATDLFLPESGYLILRNDETECLISTRKGGNISLYRRDGSAFFADYGWQISAGKACLVSNWWGSSALEHRQGNTIRIKGQFVRTTEHSSAPWQHIVLRISSLLLGPVIIAALKRRLIFQKSSAGYSFSRQITLSKTGLEIQDTLRGIKDPARLRKAPLASRRHVASADSFHPEDLALSKNCHSHREISQQGREIIVRESVHFEA